VWIDEEENIESIEIVIQQNIRESKKKDRKLLLSSESVFLSSGTTKPQAHQGWKVIKSIYEIVGLHI
jgi:hypothetical protein